MMMRTWFVAALPSVIGWPGSVLIGDDGGPLTVVRSRDLHQHRQASPPDDSSTTALSSPSGSWSIGAATCDAGEFAIVGDHLGISAFFSIFEWRWLLGTVVLLANWPYTIFVIVLTNRRLMNTPPDAAAGERCRKVPHDWVVGHSSCRRCALGFAATLNLPFVFRKSCRQRRCTKYDFTLTALPHLSSE